LAVYISRSEAIGIGIADCNDSNDLKPTGGIMSFGLYLIGFLVMIAGLVYGAAILHISTHWIVVGTLVLIGFGILTGVKATRQKDPSA
jgi:hypothetical protein